MEATELLKTLETAAGNLRKFLESAENKSGEKAAEDYVKEHELEYIEDSVKRVFKAGFIFLLEVCLVVQMCKGRVGGPRWNTGKLTKTTSA